MRFLGGRPIANLALVPENDDTPTLASLEFGPQE